MGRAHLEISGRVQGVGFRWFARERARTLGLSGWVRNNDDGSVEIAAEGPDDRMGEFVSQLRSGPPGASVSAVRELPDPPADLPHPFAILR